MKPKHILAQLREKGIHVKNKAQIISRINQLKKEKYGRTKISLGEFERFCINHKEIPDEDKGFVAAYFVSYDDNELDDEEDDDEGETVDSANENCGKKFRVFFTTKRLVEIATKTNKIHADATYKLIWEGAPVLMDGTTDLDRHFHPYGINVLSNEKTADFVFIFKSLVEIAERLRLKLKIEILISDLGAPEAIRNAFLLVFGEDLLIIMCWAHVLY